MLCVETWLELQAVLRLGHPVTKLEPLPVLLLQALLMDVLLMQTTFLGTGTVLRHLVTELGLLSVLPLHTLLRLQSLPSLVTQLQAVSTVERIPAVLQMTG